MKKAFIITSVIDINNDHALSYSQVRTYFDSSERLRQTTFTVATLDMLGGPGDTIFLIDASENADQFKDIFSYQRNLVYISVKDEFPTIFNTVRTHPNKSHGESLLLSHFIKKYKTQLEEYDYFFKMSGRYFTDSSFDTAMFNEGNVDKIFFKHSLKFDWNDGWNYHMVDRRAAQGDNKLHQYSSVLYGWGRMNLDKMLDIFVTIAVFTNLPEGAIYDVETLLYFLTRVYKSDVIETDWMIYGWDGAAGIFLRY